MSKRKKMAPPEQAAASAGQNIRDSAEQNAASTGKNPGAAPDKTLTTDEKLDLVRVLVDNVAEDFNEEDILHMMLEKKVSVDLERSLHAATTFGQRTADKIAKFAGSWGFIFSFTALLL